MDLDIRRRSCFTPNVQRVIAGGGERPHRLVDGAALPLCQVEFAFNRDRLAL